LEVGRDDEALQVVHKLHGGDKVSADKEYTEMYDAIKAEVSIRSRRISDLWATRAMTHRTFVAIGVQVFCQFTGINGKFLMIINFAETHLGFVQLSTITVQQYTIVWAL
jgi:hypothetical protein